MFFYKNIDYYKKVFILGHINKYGVKFTTFKTENIKNYNNICKYLSKIKMS